MLKKFGVLGALSQFWELHFFGILGVLKFGRMGVHLYTPYTNCLLRGVSFVRSPGTSKLLKNTTKIWSSCSANVTRGYKVLQINTLEYEYTVCS